MPGWQERQELIRQGRCIICRKEAAEGCTRCKPCLKYNAQMQHQKEEARRQAGLCIRCGLVAVPGYKQCQRHADEAREKYRALKKKKGVETIRPYRRKMTRRREESA